MLLEECFKSVKQSNQLCVVEAAEVVDAGKNSMYVEVLERCFIWKI